MSADFPQFEGALCPEIGDPELWFPQKGGDSGAARAVCGRCPARIDCLEYAMANPVSGIWGGTSHKQRAELAHRQGRPYNETTGVHDSARLGIKPESARRREQRRAQQHERAAS